MLDFDKIPTYSVSEIERLSIDFLQKSSWPTIEIPIDIDFLIEKEPGVTLDYMKYLKERFHVAGVVLKRGEGAFLVLMDEDVADNNPNFYRFTVAEELAHLKLHRKILDQITDIESACEFLEWCGYHEIDRNAKKFAACLLMPSEYVLEDARRLYSKLVKIAGFNAPDAVLNYMANILSKKYRVSSQAMGYRLNEWPIKINEKVMAAMKEELPFLD